MAAADGSAVLCLLRVSDHLESICNFFFTENFDFRNLKNFAMYDVITEVPVGKIFSEKKILQIDSKWSETRKKHKTADPSAAAVADRRRRRRPIFSVEYVNTSYHTTFHQNVSINVACIQKRVLVA